MLLPQCAHVWSLLPSEAHRRGCQCDVVCQDVVAVHPQNLLQEVRSPAQDRFTKVATTRSATATATARSAGGRDVSDGLNNIEFISLALCEACYVIAS